MRNTKQTTFLEKCGFKDEELSDATHDDIILHYMEEENVIRDFKNHIDVGGKKEYGLRYWTWPEGRFAEPAVIGLYMRVLGDGPQYGVVSIKTEQPIATPTGFVVGFVDLIIEITTYWNNYDLEFHNIYLEPIEDDKIGEIKPDTLNRWVKSPKINHVFWVEVKSRPITNYGEVMRQINTYRQFMNPKKYNVPTTGFVLITHGKCRYKQAFENQGVLVIEHGQ